MKIDEIKKKFLESNYKIFDTINKELNELFENVQKSKRHNFKNLLYSNTKKLDLLKKLELEELFLMNIHDKFILSILNISIYNALVNGDYEILFNGIYTYTHLRNLNRLHLNGFKFNSFIEHLIINENLFIKEDDWKKYIVKKFTENFGEQIEGKFDIELMTILQKTTMEEKDIDTNFNELLKLYPKCQWLNKGWYRECILIKFLPIFLVGIYKLINQEIDIKTNNQWLIEFIKYLKENREGKLVYNFTGKIEFLNRILNKDYNEFSKEYKSKCHFA